MEITNSITMMEAAYDTIKKAILKGYFNEGAQLVEADLIQKMNISRTPLREALRKLEQEGIVVRRPYKGVFVNTITKEHAAEIYRVQAVLEGLAARLVAEKRDDKMLAELQHVIDAAYQEFNDHNTDEAIQHSQAFHHNIWKYSGNSVVISMLNTLKDFITILRHKTLIDVQRMKENLTGHRLILAAIAAKNGAEAERLMIEHIVEASRVAMKKLVEQR